jgi:hypothetical protein
MTDSTARTAANAIALSAGVAAAYVVLTRPRLRRLALRGLEWWLGASLPVYLLSEISRAWADSRTAA